MRSKIFKDSLVIGLALFSMFFGAGNLIFPPFLGHLVGEQFGPALFGFLAAGIGLPLLGIIACARIDGSFETMGARIGNKFTVGGMIILTMIIGPLIAIPRTASTAYELGISTLLPTASSTLTAFIYFAIALAFVLKPSTVIDVIGKILTPILLIVLLGIIIKGLIVPIGVPVNTGFENPLVYGLTEGYNTMDALASVIFATIVISAVKSKGYTEPKTTSKVMIYSALIASIGLAVVYGGLMLLGTQVSGLETANFSRINLMIHIADEIFGTFGVALLSMVTLLACLTTAIALLTTSSEFFTKLFNNRIPYHYVALMLTVMSFFMASHEVDRIVEIAAPILDIIYPVVIVMIVLTLLNKWVVEDKIFKVVVLSTLAFSLFTTKSSIFALDSINHLLSFIPLQSHGFGWIIVSFIIFVVVSIFYRIKSNKDDKENYKKKYI